MKKVLTIIVFILTTVILVAQTSAITYANEQDVRWELVYSNSGKVPTDTYLDVLTINNNVHDSNYLSYWTKTMFKIDNEPSFYVLSYKHVDLQTNKVKILREIFFDFAGKLMQDKKYPEAIWKDIPDKSNIQGEIDKVTEWCIFNNVI